MKTERLLVTVIVLMSVVVVLQAATLFVYRGPGGSAARPASPSPRSTVADAPSGSLVDIAGMPARGSTGATVALIEFSDYECPFCARHATTVAGELQEKFVDTGKIRYVFANNPLPGHPNAKMLATAAICAGEQDKYWEMHDKLFEIKPRARPDVMSLAATLALDATTFTKCLDEAPNALPRIERDIQKAQEFKLTGTPAFGIGTVRSDGQVVIRNFISGAQRFDVFEKSLNDAIASGGAK